MLTKAGAKLLDFGLAKLKPPEQAGGLSALPTQPADLTQQGAILGTFQYMAPEQLEGQEADHRTDIFAFGAVVYEMVTGKKAFEGKSQASLISAIMTADPPAMSELDEMSPPLLDSVVKTCLAKDPEGRWQSAGDVGRQLEFIQGGSRPKVAERVVATPEPARLRRAIGLAAAALVLGLAIGGVGVWRAMQPAPRSVARFAIPTEGLVTSLDFPAIGTSGGPSGIALSPDGKTLAYLSLRDGPQLYQRSLHQLEAVPIRGTEEGCCPFFSPDGEWLGFWNLRSRDLQRVPLTGGVPTSILPIEIVGDVTWGPENTIVYGAFGPAAGLWQVAAAGGRPQRMATPNRDDGELMYGTPTVLRDGQVVLFEVWYEAQQSRQIAVRSLETGDQRVLVEGTTPSFAGASHLVFQRDGSLWAALFDTGHLRLDGEPVPVLQSVRTHTSGFAYYAIGGDGSLAYLPGGVSEDSPRRLVWVDRSGGEEAVRSIPRAEWYVYPRISPDGNHVAVGVLDGPSANLWVLGIERESRSQATFGASNHQFYPIWTPDGSQLTFADSTNPTNRIQLVPAGGGARATLLDRSERQFPTSWSPDGRALAFYVDHPDTLRDLWVLPVAADGTPGTPVEFLATQSQERGATFSPDGRWLAFVSDKSGQDEVYVRPYPATGPQEYTISAGGGEEPVWSWDGHELFYRKDDQMMVVPVDTTGSFGHGSPELLFTGTYDPDTSISGGIPNYDVATDGRFLMIKLVEPATSSSAEIVLVQNWFEELKRLVPVD